MRAQDIEALLHHFKKGDPQATLNLMAVFCRSNDGVSVAVMSAMAFVVRTLGPTERIEQHRRNTDLKRKMEIEFRERGSREKAYIAVADETVGVDRLRQIDRDKSTKPLLDFILLAENGGAISGEQLAAAQDSIASIRRQLLDGGGKSRAKRAQLLDATGLDHQERSSWGDLGKIHFDEEHYADVEALLAQGAELHDAIKRVAAATGEAASKIKTNHYRYSTR